MWSSCSCALPSRRGLPLMGKAISNPLSISTWIFPASWRARTGLSTKVLMPLPDYKVSMLSCQLLRSTQLPDLEAYGLPELDLPFDGEHGFATPFAHVDVDRSVLVAVEEESEAFTGEDSRHGFGVYPGREQGGEASCGKT